MKQQTTLTNSNISRWAVLFLCGLLGILAVGCGSTQQVQHDQEQAATNSTAQPQSQTQADQQNEEARTEALKEQYREQLWDDYQAEANEVTTFYILAQRRFYSGDYQHALNLVNKAMEVRENADLYALRGSIYLGLQNTKKFVGNWRQALSMDENVPLPFTNYIVEQLKEHGLINENLERNF